MEVPVVKKPFHISPEKVAYGKEVRKRTLTLKQRKAIAEYLRTGVKTTSYLAAYPCRDRSHAQPTANAFFKRPKIVNALEKALKNSKFDDQYAVKTLKEIIDSGMENKDITRPDTSLKALETYFKITNKMGGGPKSPFRLDPETQAKRMDVTQLRQGLKELDKKQKRILALLGKSEEGEII